MSAQGEYETRFRVEADHPALAGHFPGNPLLPGVVVLDRVISAAEEWLGGAWRTGGVPQAKFIAPLRPGDTAVVHLLCRADRVHFTVRAGEAVVAQGVLSPAAGSTGGAREP